MVYFQLPFCIVYREFFGQTSSLFLATAFKHVNWEWKMFKGFLVCSNSLMITLFRCNLLTVLNVMVA